ncbi:MAG: dynamin family protein, partial [Chlamydiia bacterium]|nr:dynamin family protein [Chlamydiia bacterium]
DISELEASIKELETEKASLAQQLQERTTQNANIEEEYRDIAPKYELVSSVLSAKPLVNESFENFKKLADKEFLQFANEEASLPEAEKAVINLHNLIDRIQMMLNFTGIYNKNVVAVGGGFSAGKSEFISCFMKDKKIRLPIGIKPVTAIPSYVIPAKESVIRGFGTSGGSTVIPQSIFAKITHDYLKSMQFNLREVMPTVAIATPLKYKHICFIDTPGYDSVGTEKGYTDSDLSTARKFLEKANVFLWLINLDGDGTLSANDLDFINDLTLNNKKVFFIANKADLKERKEIKQILSNLTKTLNNEGIEYVGISAYNSLKGKEISFRKKSLLDFLRMQDKKVENYEFITELEEIFEMYRTAIQYDIDENKNIYDELHSLGLDILEASPSVFDQENNSVATIRNRVARLNKKFVTKELEGQLKELTTVRELMTGELRDIFKSIVDQGRE